MSSVRWQFPVQADADAVEVLHTRLQVHPLCAELLVRRGLGAPDEAERFLRCDLKDLPDPFLMKGMAAAAPRLAQAITTGERIILFGDYDVDGVTSTSLMTGMLEALGAKSEFYIPNRLEEGYGLSSSAVEGLAKAGKGLLIALDCGVTAVAEVEHAVKCGLEVVIVDHHTAPASLPRALAILNPHQEGCGFPTKHLCAAGVAFFLLAGTRKLLREQGYFKARAEPNLKEWLDLVALATVADVVPLLGANRILVKHGLEILAKGLRPGVRALKEVAGVNPGAVTAGQVGFKLGPRINAAGRLGSAREAVRLLTTPSFELAQQLAKALDTQNQQRRDIEARMTREALLQAEVQVAAGMRGLVLAQEGWHAGVVGIVAARVAERFHRPTLVIALADGLGKGSGRSVEGFHLHGALSALEKGVLVHFGGHKHAVGLQVLERNLVTLQTAFAAMAADQLKPEDLVPRLRLDAELDVGQISMDLVHQLEKLGPFGSGNPDPVFFSRVVATEVRHMNNKREGGLPHLKMKLKGGAGAEGPVEAIGWELAPLVGLGHKSALEAAFKLDTTDFGGPLRPQLTLKHVQPFVPSK